MGRKRKGRAKRAAGDTGTGAATAENTGAVTGDSAAAGATEAERPLGHVTVEVDRAAILAEAATVAAEAPAPPVAGSTDTAESASAPGPEIAGAAPVDAPVQVSAEDLKQALRLAAGELAVMVAPNWEIEQSESDAVADAGALVLQYWMPPGAVDPKWLAVAMLAGSVYAIARRRRLEDGTWKPLRAKPKAPAPAPAPSPPPPASTPLRI